FPPVCVLIRPLKDGRRGAGPRCRQLNVALASVVELTPVSALSAGADRIVGRLHAARLSAVESTRIRAGILQLSAGVFALFFIVLSPTDVRCCYELHAINARTQATHGGYTQVHGASGKRSIDA